jgi:hypothetical protein
VQLAELRRSVQGCVTTELLTKEFRRNGKQLTVQILEQASADIGKALGQKIKKSAGKQMEEL